jgi:hypothetical protein
MKTGILAEMKQEQQLAEFANLESYVHSDEE